jgi:hypothetical protein
LDMSLRTKRLLSNATNQWRCVADLSLFAVIGGTLFKRFL